MRIIAAVATWNRRERLTRWIAAMRSQTHPLAGMVVVDNGGSDGTTEMLRADYPEITCVRLEENTGSAGGMEAALRCAHGLGCDWVWAFDDDALPSRDALEQMVASLSEARSGGRGRGPGMLLAPYGMSTAWRWKSRKVPVRLPAPVEGDSRPIQVDQVDLNMTLVSSALMEEIGFPRGEFFAMMWAMEYCFRATEAGFSIWVAPRVLVSHEHAGSTGTGMWRNYYQARNYLALMLERKKPLEFLYWFGREAKMLTAACLSPQPLKRIRLRLCGVRDAFLGRSGQTLRPGGLG